MSAFHDLTRDVMRATRLNPDWFAEEVTLVFGEQTYRVDAHVRHSMRREQDADGSERVIEQARVEIDKRDLDRAPDYGDKLFVADDDRPYLYQYAGRHRLVSYCSVFERERHTAQGTRPRGSQR